MAEISILNYSITGNANGVQAAVVFGDGQTKMISDTHSNFKLITRLLEEKPEGYAEKVHELVNVVNTLNKRFQDLSPRVTTDGSDLYFDGDAIDNALSKFILKLHREDAERTVSFLNGGTDTSEQGQVTWEALVKFLELLYSNPNPQSRESLYSFITRHGLTIRKDGHFIAYKGLNSDFGSINRGYGIVDGVEHTGSLPNKPGSILRFPRKDVESNTAIGCARGLHAGTHRYASGWARGKLVAVAINPMHVVSVPDDSSYQKIRVCEYEILNEVDPLEEAVATGGWSSSSLWTDDYKSTDSALKDLKSGDVLSFDYVSLNGDSQHVEDAQVDWASSDDFTAFVPEKDGYRTFKFSGVANAVVNGEGAPEGTDESDSGDEAAASDSTEGPAADASSEDSTKADEPNAESGEQFFDRIYDFFLNGGGFKPEDLLKDAGKLIPEGVLPENVDLKEIKDLGEKVKRIATGEEQLGLGDVLDVFGEKLGSGLFGTLLGDSKGSGFEDIFSDILGGNKQKDETPQADEPKDEEPAAPDAAKDAFADLKVGDVVSFDYVGRQGDAQHVTDAEVLEIDGVRLQTYVPSKAGHRTFLKDSISNLTVGAAAKPLDLKIGETITVELVTKGELQKYSGAKVVLADAHSATVRLQSGGYRSFEAKNVKSISRI